MNKLETINSSITEIREILGAECASVGQLPDLVRTLSEEASKSGYTTAFLFSTESNPNIPTGGSLDTTGLVIGIEDGWSQSMAANPANVWMSFAVFNPSGERVTEWSVPVDLKGEKGDPGQPGPAGETGPQGLPGNKGEVGSSYRTVSVYTTTDSGEEVPETPKNGYWNIKTNEITLPVTNNPNISWKLNVSDFSKPKKHVWVSSVTFGEDGMPMGNWSTPFRITGDDGKNGADGRVTEFIYRLLPDYDTYVSLWEHLAEKELSNENEPDYLPKRNDNIVDTDWTDSPEGISPSMQIEVVCSRTRKSVEEPWGKWSNCTIWAKWGEDGIDGDGVEYVYLITPPLTSEDVKSGSAYTPDLDEAMSNPRYQEGEFCFNGDFGYNNYDWIDEPIDVGSDKPMEWVMSRKYRNGKWERFSEPALWAKYSEDGKDANLEDFSNVNLIPNSTSFVFSGDGPSTGYGRISLPIKVNSGEKYTFKCEDSESLSDNETSYLVLITKSAGNKENISESSINLSFGKNQYGTITIKEGVSDCKADLLFYRANLSPDEPTRIGQAQFSNFSLVKGTTPLAVWEDYRENLDNLLSIDKVYDFSAGGLLPIKTGVKKGEVYTLHWTKKSSGSIGFQIFNDENKGISEYISSDENSDWITCIITDNCDNPNLLIDNAGSGSITELSLVKGSRPMMYWKTGKDVVGLPGEEGRGVDRIEKTFAANDDSQNHPADDDFGELAHVAGTNYKYIWCKEVTYYTDGTSSAPIYYIVSVKGEPGATGTGNDAPIIYPAGVWNLSTTYTATSTRLPYVFYTGDEDGGDVSKRGYYLAKKVTSNKTSTIGKRPYEDTEFWESMESFEAIYADAGVFNQALVGKFVFHKDYVFSQEGIDEEGNAVTYDNYIEYTSENRAFGPAGAIFDRVFKPNILFNAVTGEGNLNNIIVSRVDTRPSENSAKITIQDEQLTVVGDGKVVYIGNSTYDENVFTFDPINEDLDNDTQYDFYGRKTIWTQSTENIKMSAPRQINITFTGDVHVMPGGNNIPNLKIYVRLYKDGTFYKSRTFTADRSHDVTLSGGGRIVYTIIDTWEIPEGEYTSMNFDVSVGNDNTLAHTILKGVGFNLKVNQQISGDTITALGLDGLRLTDSQKAISIGRYKTYLKYGDSTFTMDKDGIVLKFGSNYGLRLTKDGIEKTTDGSSWNAL